MISYSDHERLAALERRVQELEAQVQLLHDLVGQRVGLGQAIASSESYDLVLTQYPAVQKISVIKLLREITGTGLAEAKSMSESLPCTFVQRATGELARDVERRMREVGAVVDLRPR